MNNSQFSCPYCGEMISKTAKLCRFCKSTVSYDLYIFQIPEDTKRGEIAKKILEMDKKKFFNSFGSARKALEKKDTPFLENLRMEDAEKFTKIFQDNEIPFDQTIHNHNVNETFWNKNIFMILTAGTVVLFISAYFFRQKTDSTSPASTQITSLLNRPTINHQEKPTENNESPQLSKEAHANIESLLISTATVFVEGGEGSAFFVSHDGHLISNQHVTKNFKEVQIQTFDGKKYKGNVLKSDPYYDLALIQIDSIDYPPLRIGDATKLHPGDTVWTIGAPHGLSFSVTKGIASFIGRNVSGKSFLQADVAINPGNSGGPMINDDGEVVGINNFILKETQGLNFAIPVNYLYMGSAPILDGVINTQPDNATMVTWRSWERGAPSPTTSTNESSPETKTPSESEIDNLSKQLRNAETELNTRIKKKDSEIADLQKKIDTFAMGFKNAQTVSDQELIVQTIKKLKIQKIDLEIEKIDFFLSYNRIATDLMTRAKQISITDNAATQHYNQEITKLNQNRKISEEDKAQKEAEKKSLSS